MCHRKGFSTPGQVENAHPGGTMSPGVCRVRMVAVGTRFSLRGSPPLSPVTEGASVMSRCFSGRGSSGGQSQTADVSHILKPNLHFLGPGLQKNVQECTPDSLEKKVLQEKIFCFRLHFIHRILQHTVCSFGGKKHFVS